MIVLVLIAATLMFINSASVAYASETFNSESPVDVYQIFNSQPNQRVMAQAETNQAEGCDINGGVQQCCSGAGCTGKVLSHRDLHNCKTKSTGKSWTEGKGICNNKRL